MIQDIEIAHRDGVLCYRKKMMGDWHPWEAVTACETTQTQGLGDLPRPRHRGWQPTPYRDMIPSDMTPRVVILQVDDDLFLSYWSAGWRCPVPLPKPETAQLRAGKLTETTRIIAHSTVRQLTVDLTSWAKGRTIAMFELP